jgi:hypothetical protein
MPQFFSQSAAAAGAQYGDFIRGYIMAMYFTDTGDDGQPDSEIELSAEAIENIVKECRQFCRVNRRLLQNAKQRQGYSMERAGHDFWLTRNGHGAGFWDRDELKDSGRRRVNLGALLSGACKPFGESDSYEGDDGLLYVT